jgi:hypothetical protein
VLTTDDIVEIHQLLALYGHAADSGDAETLAQVFTADGVFDGSACAVGTYRGLGELSAWFALGQPTHPRGHQTSNYYVYEEAGRVCARSKWIVVNPATGGAMTGDYEDVLVRAEDGWRIQHRTSTPRSFTPDWARGEDHP